MRAVEDGVVRTHEIRGPEQPNCRLFIDEPAGNVGVGVATLVGTFAAVAMLAPTMPLLGAIAAIGLRVNSYKLATTGASLLTDASTALNAANEKFSKAATPSASKS